MRNLNPVKPDNPEIMDIAPDRKKTAGERIFDRTVYTGIGFGFNEGLSLWITDQFKYGKNLFKNVPGLKTFGEWFSEKGYDRASDAVTKAFRFTDKVDKQGKLWTAKERGANSLLMMTLIVGGTLLILPMKWLEDSKGYWVKKANHWADKRVGNKLTPEQVEARDKEVEEHIACSPRQSWPSMLLGRTIAVTTSWATGTFLMGPKRNEDLQNWTEKKFTGSIQSVQPGEQKTWGRRYLRLGSLETYSCGISAIMLEVMSKLFAKRSSKPHDPVRCEQINAEKNRALPAASSGSGGDNTITTDSGCAPGRHCANIQAQREQVANEPATAQI